MLFGLGVAHACGHRDAGRAEPRHPIAIGARIGIMRGDHHPRHAGGNQAVGTTGPARANMGAGFQRDKGGGAACGLTGLGQRHSFGMWAAARLCPAAPDDAPAVHDHAAD